MIDFIREKALLVATESKKKFTQGRAISAKIKSKEIISRNY